MSSRSSVETFHGRPTSQSTYVRITPTSGEADGIRLIRSISLIARARTSSGMPADSTFSRSSLISACWGSSSPSSRWMALSCSRRMYSRWVLSISDLTSLWIFPLSSRISTWRARKLLTSLSRCSTSIVSSSSWRCSVDMSGLYATMSASRPGSVMLRAATAASGGTGAPFATYCSICACTLRMSAWISTPSGVSSGSSSTRAARYGPVWVKPWTRMRVWPWTIARTVPSWSCTTWAILARVPTEYSSDGSSMSSCSACRWVTSAMGPEASTAALSAATLFSRPTWSGTIISGKMTVSRSATSGSSRTSRAAVSGSGDGVDGGLAISGSPWVPASSSAIRFGCLVSVGWGTRSRSIRTAVRAGPRGAGGALRGRAATGRGVGSPFAGSFVIEGLEDALAQALLELEEGPDPGEVDAAVTGEVPDPQDPPDVLLRVEPDVGGRARRTDQALVLVDAQRPRVRRHEGRRDADDVDGHGRVPVGPARGGHRLCLDRLRCGAVRGTRLDGRGLHGRGLAAADRADPDLLRFDLFGLGDSELEDAVLERCLGLVGLQPRREGHRAHHAAARDLADHPALLLAGPLAAVLGADGEGPVIDGDVDVLRRDARERGLDEEGIRCRADIERKTGEVALVGVRRERAEDGVVEQAVHRLAKRHELAEGRRSTGQRHGSSLLLPPAVNRRAGAVGGRGRRWSKRRWSEGWVASPDKRQAKTLTMVLSRYMCMKGHKPSDIADRHRPGSGPAEDRRRVAPCSRRPARQRPRRCSRGVAFSRVRQLRGSRPSSRRVASPRPQCPRHPLSPAGRPWVRARRARRAHREARGRADHPS